jgi:hypothetical protein
MSQRTNRRTFLKTSAATGIGFWVAGGVKAQPSNSPNEQIQIASFGVDGKGSSDSRNAARHGKMFAVCDADRTRLDLAAGRFGTDYKYTDFRELLDQLGDRIDAVTVSTPDHNHAVIAAKAMKMGKHVYCQKPLTRSIWEARQLGEIAKEKGVSTQMGNQYTAYNPMREAAYRVRAGNLGTVKEVHVWTNRPIWPQGGPRNPSKRLGIVARPGAVARVRGWISPIRLARLVGLRHRLARRHGVPHLQPALHGAQHARPDRSSGRDVGPQPGQLPDAVEDPIHVSRT